MRWRCPTRTYELDIVLLVGRLRLLEHQTVDEIHQEVLKRLEPLGVKIARREILYLFEAYCTLMHHPQRLEPIVEDEPPRQIEDRDVADGALDDLHR